MNERIVVFFFFVIQKYVSTEFKMNSILTVRHESQNKTDSKLLCFSKTQNT